MQLKFALSTGLGELLSFEFVTSEKIGVTLPTGSLAVGHWKIFLPE